MDALNVWIFPYVQDELICPSRGTYGHDLLLFEAILGRITHGLLSKSDPRITHILRNIWEKHVIHGNRLEYLRVAVSHGYEPSLDYMLRHFGDKYMIEITKTMDMYEEHWDFYLTLCGKMNSWKMTEHVFDIGVMRRFDSIRKLKRTPFVLELAVKYYETGDQLLYDIITECILVSSMAIQALRRLLLFREFDDIIITYVENIDYRSATEIYAIAVSLGRDDFAERILPYTKEN